MSSSNAEKQLEPWSVLVTGANNGLGYSICRRLINDFLFTQRYPKKLHIIITTRDQAKGDDTVRRLKKHLARRIGYTNHWYPASRPFLENRITFQQEILELTSLRSVQALGKKLIEDGKKIDVLIFNAGIGGWTGMKWPILFKGLLTDYAYTLTWTTYKLSAVGWTTKPQIPTKEGDASDEPPVGEVFCANVFGHYLLGHYLSPLLLRKPEDEHSCSRIIWLSSIDLDSEAFSLNDLQGIKSERPYESSKRLIDLIALTAQLPSTSTWVTQYSQAQSSQDSKSKGASSIAPQVQIPKHYVCHPGVCKTTIYELFFIISWFFLLALIVARWFGSIWHPATAYKGAVAPVWLALEEQSRLDNLEKVGGEGKWGSACDRLGRERYERTEVEGWGYGGRVEPLFNKAPEKRKGRKRGVPALTAELREQFEDLGRACWKELESLRLEWEARLAKADANL